MARGVAQRYVDTVQPLLALGARVRKPRSYEASPRMFFEFSNGDSLRMIDESSRAPIVDESRLCWMTIAAAM